jgi:glycine/D-amino acid oxidase-like deaminating enzyme
MDDRVIEIDVLVIGGGLQGLLILHELTVAGRSCVLVANSDLGGGQTLHAHGVLNTGFGFSGPDLREIRDSLVLPFLRERHIDTYGDWFLVTPGDTPVGVPVTTDSLPRGFEAGGAQVLRLHELNIPTRRLVESLTRANLGRIVHGHVTNVRASGAIDTLEVSLETAGEKLTFAPGCVIAATGTGTKRFVGRLGGEADQLAKIKHRRVQMLCVRGPAGLLPAVSILSLQHRLNVVAHELDREVTWYSTPFQDADPHYDDVPDNAEAAVDPDVVAEGFQRLESLFPALARTPELRFTAYAGYRQDIGETVGTPMCEIVRGLSNLLVVLPSLMVNVWPNAGAAAQMVTAIVPKKTRQPSIRHAGAGVRVASLRVERPGMQWRTWRDVTA